MDSTGGIMKTILCYGDSNTWGYNPESGTRFAADERWCGVMRAELGGGYQVIEEGLCGRTTVWDDPIEGEHKNGRRCILSCVETHSPLDLVIIMLGTNDLKYRFSVRADDAARGAGTLARIVKSSGTGRGGVSPEVLLVAPPSFASLEGTKFADIFHGGEEKSLRFAEAFRASADECGAYYFDAGSVIKASVTDAIHLESGMHRILGNALIHEVKRIVG